MGAILQVQVELDVTGMVHIIQTVSVATVTARSQRADAPSTHTVGTSGEIELFKRKTLGVSVRHGHSHSHMEHQGITVVNHKVLGIVEICLYILCKADVGHLIGFSVFRTAVNHPRKQIQQVARLFDIETNGVRIALRRFQCGGTRAVVSIRIPQAHDEQIFIAIAQQGVSFVHIVQVFTESFRTIGHVDVVQVEHIETMGRSPLSPTVTPGRRSYRTLKLRANLPVVFHRHLGSSTAPTAEIRRKEGKHEFRKAQAGFHSIFQVVAVGISFQARNGFVCSTQLKGEGFRPLEQVPVRISYGSGSSQVASRVGSFNFKGKRLVLVAGKHDIGIQISRIGLQLFTETDVGIFQDIKTSQCRIGALHIAGTIKISGFQIIIVADDLRT